MPEERLPTDLPASLALDLAERALRECGLEVRGIERSDIGSVVRGSLGSSLLSGGEHVEIEVERDGAGGCFVLRSSASGRQSLDWGKNARNVRRIRETMERLLDR